MSARPLLRLHGITVGYGGRTVLDGIDLTLDAGDRLAVTGGNGTGKTTLLHTIVGLLPTAAGRIEILGRPCRNESDFAKIRPMVGLLFQDADDQLFCPTVLEDVAFGPLNLGRSRKEAIRIAERTLESLGIAALADRVTHRLSGGEKKLVSLATVLAMEPRILLLDEPTNGVDRDGRERLTALLEALPQALILVSHETDLIEHLSTRILVMKDGHLLPAEIHDHAHVHRHGHVHPREGSGDGTVHLGEAETAHDRHEHPEDGPRLT